MLDLAERPTTAVSEGPIRTGSVQEIRPEDGSLRVRPDGAGPEGEIRARVALPGGQRPATGSRVVLACQDRETAWIIGVVDEAPGPGERRMSLADGSSVRVVEDSGGQKMRLVSDGEELLLEYDTGSGKLTLAAPDGDLELVSREGDIVLDAARSVRLSGHSVEATGRARLHLGVVDGTGRVRSLLGLDPSTARLASPGLRVASERASVHVGETTVRGDRLLARLGSLEIVADRIERLAEEIHEQASRVYRTVRELMVLRAGRIRSRVKASYRLTVGRAFFRSDEDFKIKGERIHLG